MANFYLVLLLTWINFAQAFAGFSSSTHLLPFPTYSLPPNLYCGTTFFGCLMFFFDTILRIILTLALILTTFFIASAGILYITKGGNKEEDIRKIHQRLVWATIGFIVTFLAYVFVSALELWIWQGNVYLFNFVYAQKIQEPATPTELKCGYAHSLPSTLERIIPSSTNIWEDCFLYYVERILNLLYFLALTFGVIFLALAGISYISQPDKIKDIHRRLIYGIIGIVIAMLSFTIVKIIDIFFTGP